MAKVSLRVLLFCAGFLVAGAGAAYFSGALGPAKEQVAEMASVAMPENSASSQADRPQGGQPAASLPGEGSQTQSSEAALPGDAVSGGESAELAGGKDVASKSGVVVPRFDVLRVEPDGSMVVAGRAAPGAEVEVLGGSSILATTQATGSGDFAAVLDKALKPGEHNIVLRGTSPGSVATSIETAIVSIPSNEEGQVVALVQEPGEPSRLITVPQAQLPAPLDGKREDQQMAGNPEATNDLPSRDDANADGTGATARAEGLDDKAVGTVASAPQEGTTSAGQGAAMQAPAVGTDGVSPFIEAVEIDGRKVFVAGRAEPGRRVRVYVNDILLGQADVVPEGTFLIEAERDLPAGDYIIRVDVLGDDGLTVIARAAVPFERPAGEKFAAVAGDKDHALLPGKRMGDAASGADGGQPGDAAASSGETEERLAGVETDGTEEQQAGITGHSNSTVAQASADGGLIGGEIVLPPLEPSQASSVIIRRGDTLWHISRRVYGQGPRYTTIYLANQDQIRDPDLIYPGQTFTLPEETEEGEKADPGAIGEQARSSGLARASDRDS